MGDFRDVVSWYCSCQLTTLGSLFRHTKPRAVMPCGLPKRYGSLFTGLWLPHLRPHCLETGISSGPYARTDYGLLFYYCPRGSDGPYCCRRNVSSVSTITHERLQLSLTRFYINMQLDNRTKTREFQGHRSKVKVTGPDFRILYHCEIGQKVC